MKLVGEEEEEDKWGSSISGQRVGGTLFGWEERKIRGQ
jgi:hypothetical protein